MPVAIRGKEWERVRDDVMSKPNTQRVVRTLQQKLVGSSAVLELDANGRLSIPASHRNAVGIEKKPCCWAWATSSNSGASRHIAH